MEQEQLVVLVELVVVWLLPILVQVVAVAVLLLLVLLAVVAVLERILKHKLIPLLLLILTLLVLAELLELTPERFATVFKGTPIKRVKHAGLLRNACIVAGNSGDVSLLPQLVRLAAHELPLIRVHAVWAVRRLGGESRLAAAQAAETDAAVLEEYGAPAADY